MNFTLSKQDAYVAAASATTTILVLSFASHIPAIGIAVKFILGF